MSQFFIVLISTLLATAALAKGQFAISSLECSNKSKNLQIKMDGQRTGSGKWDGSATLSIQLEGKDITDGRVIGYQIVDGWRNIPSLDIHEISFYSNEDMALSLEILMVQDQDLNEQNFHGGKLYLKRGFFRDSTISFICRVVR